MGWVSKKNSIYALVVLQGLFLFGVLPIGAADMGPLGIKWSWIFGGMSALLLYFVYETFGSR